jgi:hypothetical protein
MKKIILVLAVALTTLSSFASDRTVDPKVVELFKTEFVAAKEVNWTVAETYFKADFVFNDQRVSAYYSTEGELLGVTRFITVLDLPMNLQMALKKSYSSYWVSDLFEMTKSDATGYYITLEDADNTVVMKATSGGEWSVHKKSKKI